MPPAQVRDMTVQKRENDLVLATFGRGFYILDDYSALRELTPQALAEEARLFPLRDAYSFSQTGHGAGRERRASAPMAGNWTAPEPAVRRGVHLQREAGRCRPTRSWC